MAVVKKFSAVKKIQKHLLGIQNLSIQEANLILDEAKNFIKFLASSKISLHSTIDRLWIPKRCFWIFLTAENFFITAIKINSIGLLYHHSKLFIFLYSQLLLGV